LAAIALFLVSMGGAIACDDFDEEMAMAAAQRAVQEAAAAPEVANAQEAAAQPSAIGLASSQGGPAKEGQSTAAAADPSPVLRR
jgi:hypothetical protein